jgi:hypothetical protein
MSTKRRNSGSNATTTTTRKKKATLTTTNKAVVVKKQIAPKKPRVKKPKEKIKLVSGQGKSVRFKETVDCTLQDQSIVNDKGYLDYVGHLTSKPTIPMGSNGLPIVLDNTMKPEMSLPPHENHNMATLNTTTTDLEQIGGHYPDLSRLRNTSFFQDDDDDEDDDDYGNDYNPTNDKDLLNTRLQTIILKDRNTSSIGVFDCHNGGDDENYDVGGGDITTMNSKALEFPNNHHKSIFTNEIRTFPMEVLSEQGFTSSYTFSVNECMKIMSNEFRVKAESTEKENIEAERNALNRLNEQDKGQYTLVSHGDSIIPNGNEGGGDGEQKQTRKKRNNTNSELNTVKIAVPFANGVISIYSCNLRTNKSHLVRTVRDYNNSYDARYSKFFINDQLDGTVAYQERPEDYKMFRDLVNDFLPLFQHNSSINNDTIKMTPKFHDEAPLEKHYITAYRKRPATGEPTCSNRLFCCFKTFSRDEHITYVGKVFYTRREREIVKRHRKLVEAFRNGTSSVPPPEHIKGLNNHRGLCIDCILREYFVQVQQNIANDETPEKQINHFTVRCEEGHYNPSLMLPNMANKPTGIVGNVPAYNQHFRASVTIKKKDIVDNNLVDCITTFIAETGMDF